MTAWFAVTCPTCGYRMDGHSAIGNEDATPSEGDLSVCIACGNLAVYQKALNALVLRKPTLAEDEEALQDPRLVAAMIAHRQARAENPDWPRGPLETSRRVDFGQKPDAGTAPMYGGRDEDGL